MKNMQEQPAVWLNMCALLLPWWLLPAVKCTQQLPDPDCALIQQTVSQPRVSICVTKAHLWLKQSAVQGEVTSFFLPSKNLWLL